MAETLTRQEIQAAVTKLDALCRQEYGGDDRYGLLELLADADTELAAARLQRLTGILLKEPFARAEPIGESPSDTHANRKWDWKPEKLNDNHLQQSQEFRVLDQIRHQLPKLVRGREPTWKDFLSEADHERGVYKLLTLWVADKWKRRESKSIKEYLAQDETPEFEALLNVADLVGQAALSIALTPIIPFAPVVVSLTIIGATYGYGKITKAPERRDAVN